MEEEAGQELRAGRYVVTRALGHGGQGDTLEAVDKHAGRLVAIKRFRIRGAKQWKDVELAEREARVLASLAHPALPAHVEHFEEGGALYLVMEKIEGESLGALRRRGATLGRDEVVRFLRDAAAILDYLHGRAPPVIHRDIKPSNVIRRPDGAFAIVDFGAVRDRLRPEGGSTVVGTFGYMAPEQFQGRAMPCTDVYAVGATALCLLTGEEPEHLPHRGLALDVAAALQGRADPALVEVLAAMLEPDPDRRAGRIAPLLEKLAPPAVEARRGRKAREETRRDERKGSRRDARRDERRARKEKKSARKALKRTSWPAPPPSSSRSWRPPVGLVLFALVIARVAVALALGVFVPVLLTLMSVVFGRGLREGARGVREAGVKATRALERAYEAVRTGQWPGGARFAEQRGGEPVRVRVAEDAAEAQGDGEAQGLEEEEAEREAAEGRGGPKRARR